MPTARPEGLAVAVLLAAVPAAAGELALDQRFWSPALDREAVYGVYRPAATGPLPVVYLLHGYGAGHREWVELGGIDAILDRLIAEGTIAPLIAVMPDAEKSWYVDSRARGGPGDYATAIARDLTAHIDATLPTRAEPEARAVMGLSMGGFGGLMLGLGTPERFAQVVALSPAIFAPGGLSWQRWSLGTTAEERQRWFPGAFGTPFDEGVYRQHQPFALLAGVAAPPRLLLAAGDDDDFGFELGTVEFFLAARRRDLPVELRIADGGHDWAFWREAAVAGLRWLDEGW